MPGTAKAKTSRAKKGPTAAKARARRESRAEKGGPEEGRAQADL